MQSLQVSNPELEPPDGRDFWTDYQEGGKSPVFTLSQVAAVFFGRTKIWLWRHVDNGDFILEGELETIPRNRGGYYQFQLAHVERISHALFGHGIIDYDRFTNSLLIVKLIAKNYRLL